MQSSVTQKTYDYKCGAERTCRYQPKVPKWKILCLSLTHTRHNCNSLRLMRAGSIWSAQSVCSWRQQWWNSRWTRMFFIDQHAFESFAKLFILMIFCCCSATIWFYPPIRQFHQSFLRESAGMWIFLYFLSFLGCLFLEKKVYDLFC